MSGMANTQLRTVWNSDVRYGMCSGLQSQGVRTASSAFSGPHSLHLSPTSGPHDVDSFRALPRFDPQQHHVHWPDMESAKTWGSSDIKELFRPHDGWQRAAVSGHRG